MKERFFLKGEVVRISKPGTLANLPVGALGEVVSCGVGAKAKIWYGVRFLCVDNPHGFMDLTMWEGQIRALTNSERGVQAAAAALAS